MLNIVVTNNPVYTNIGLFSQKNYLVYQHSNLQNMV